MNREPKIIIVIDENLLYYNISFFNDSILTTT